MCSLEVAPRDKRAMSNWDVSNHKVFFENNHLPDCERVIIGFLAEYLSQPDDRQTRCTLNVNDEPHRIFPWEWYSSIWYNLQEMFILIPR